MRILFVNYINKHSVELKKYLVQNRIFITSMLIKQPSGIASLITGKSKDMMFVEALSRLREIKKKYDMPVFYLDNDCIIMNPVDDLLERDFDVAVIYRYKWLMDLGRNDCLGGFLFFKNQNKDKEDKFLKKLIKETKAFYKKELDEGIDPWYYDQYAINNLIGPPPVERNKLNYDLAFYYEPVLKEVDGVKVLYLSANEWACPMTINIPEKVRIMHYNHAIWPSKYKEDADGKPFVRGKIQPAQAVSTV